MKEVKKKTENLSALKTEQINQNTVNIDCMTTLEIIKTINNEDKTVSLAVEKELEAISAAVDKIVETFKKGGRLFYVGAGTSGRLGVLDASECPPTYGVPEGMVVGIMAGGDEALRHSVEDSEDSEEEGKSDLLKHQITPEDSVVGIAASGRSPYVIGAVEEARRRGCFTAAITCNKGSALSQKAETAIELDVGSEVIMGSTRMKSGTAQKMVLNMLTTASMIKLGKVYKNLMVDMVPSNEKLRDRAARIVMLACECDFKTAEKALLSAEYHTKSAIVMVLTGCSFEEAREKLEEHDGFVRQCL